MSSVALRHIEMPSGILYTHVDTHTEKKRKKENKTGTNSTELLCSSSNLYEHTCEDKLLFLYNVHVIVLRSLFISDYNLA